MTTIPLPEPQEADIYSLGFDKSLNRTLQVQQSPTVYNAIDGAVNTGQLPSGGSLELKDLTIGGFSKMVASGDDLSRSINDLATSGGGALQFKSGTYAVKTELVGYSSIALEGVSPSATILDFSNTAANLSFTGTNAYTTGTITAINSGVLVTGSGTSWLANVTAGQHLFLGTRWYEIAAVTGDTSLVLSEGYGDDATLPSTYRIASVKQNIIIKNLTLKNSTGTGLVFTDCRRVTLDNVIIQDCNKGIALTNVSEFSNDRLLVVSCTSNGIEWTNVGLSDWETALSISNGGVGWLMNNIKTCSLFPCLAQGNTDDGYNITTAVDVKGQFDSISNGGQGIEFVSGGMGCVIYNSRIEDNTSDGVKLTATSDDIKFIGNTIKDNGGYGINIAAATCDDTIIVANEFATNTSGHVNDSGTTTVIRGNSGVADNTTAVSSSLTGVLRADSGVLSVDTDVTDIVSAATTTLAGKVELATDAETNTGTDTTRAITPSNLEAWTGSTQVTTLGTIASGAWDGTDIPVTAGGTGASTAAGALSNLGLTATATELNYTDGVTSAIQTQLDAKQASDNTLTELAAISGVQGDIIYADGTDSWTRLAKGTAAQVLKMNSGATAPEWATSSGLGLLTSGTFSSATNDTFTVVAATNVITSTSAHGLVNGDKVTVSSSGTLPAGLTAATGYFVSSATSTTFILLDEFMDVVDITDTGSGTHTWTNAKGAIIVTFTAKTFLKVILRANAPTASCNVSLTFNTDIDKTANNYGSRVTVDGGATSANNDTFAWRSMVGGTTEEKNLEISIENFATSRKLGRWLGCSYSPTSTAATVNNITTGAGVWTNTTDQITTIKIWLSGAAGFATDSTVYVLGTD